MTKVPVAGRVKTRLGHEIGMVRAAWWVRHQIRHQVRRLSDPRWDIMLAVDPMGGVMSGALPSVRRIGQGRGDLGQRMARLLDRRGPVVLVGSDIPGIGTGHVRLAFAALGRVDMVFGPATDGGFWMVGHAGHRPLPRHLFRGVRWSGEHALSDSLATLGGRTCLLTDSLSDIDTAADLRRFPATALFRHARRGA